MTLNNPECSWFILTKNKFYWSNKYNIFLFKIRYNLYVLLNVFSVVGDEETTHWFWTICLSSLLLKQLFSLLRFPQEHRWFLFIRGTKLLSFPRTPREVRDGSTVSSRAGIPFAGLSRWISSQLARWGYLFSTKWFRLSPHWIFVICIFIVW